jgi:hypothetical protein
MRRLSLMIAILVGVGSLAALSGRPASARPPYNQEFKQKYLSEDSKMAKALGQSSSCNVCHLGANKKKRNDYGAAFQKVLKKNGGQPAIVEALDKVAKQHSKPKDEKSPTFGELIEEGKLPITK